MAKEFFLTVRTNSDFMVLFFALYSTHGAKVKFFKRIINCNLIVLLKNSEKVSQSFNTTS